MKKRIVGFLLVVAMALTTGLIPTACRQEYNFYNYEYGYFYYWRVNERLAIISGLTELGQQQRFLVVPSQIGERRVSFHRNSPSTGGGCTGTPYFLRPQAITPPPLQSENLEKVFAHGNSHISWHSSTFSETLNMRHFILLDFASVRHFRLEGLDSGTTRRFNVPTNIIYLYNYERDSREHFWADDVDYGKLIEFIPDIPQREGYIFMGWYQEPETINRWNFETDRQNLQINDNRTVYQQTRLYAKWQAM